MVWNGTIWPVVYALVLKMPMWVYSSTINKFAPVLNCYSKGQYLLNNANTWDSQDRFQIKAFRNCNAVHSLEPSTSLEINPFAVQWQYAIFV